MTESDLARFANKWGIVLASIVLLSVLTVPILFDNVVKGGNHETAKEALSLFKDATIWMAGLQTATIAALGLLAKEGVTAIKASPFQLKLAILVVLLNGIALFFSAWLLTAVPSLMLRVYQHKLADYDFYNLALYSFMEGIPVLEWFKVRYFAFWNHWLWAAGIICFGALSISVVVRQSGGAGKAGSGK